MRSLRSRCLKLRWRRCGIWYGLARRSARVAPRLSPFVEKALLFCRIKDPAALPLAEVASRIRHEPDELIGRIVAGWPTRFEAKRGLALGFKGDRSFDDIVRTHIDDELGGSFVQ